jgi:hypothetical protein
MSDGCPDKRMRRPTRGKIFCEKNHRRSTAPIAFVRRADLGHSTTRVAPISNTQSPENCCLHLIPPYVYCISNEAYFSCRNICEAFFFLFSFFFFGFGFCFFLSPCCGCIYRDEGNELSCAVSPSAAVAAGWPEHKRADGSASGHTISPHFALLRGYDPIKKKGKIPKTIQISIANLIYGNSTFFLFFGLRIE